MAAVSPQTAINRVGAGIRASLSAAGYRGLDILCAAVRHWRPLEWRAPGVIPGFGPGERLPSLFGGPGSLSLRPSATFAQVLQEYEQTLFHMRYDPTVVVSEATSSMKLNRLFDIPPRAGRLLFSTPDGGEDNGLILAMEFAAASHCLGFGTLVRSDKDFYVVLSSDVIVGIKDGVILQRPDLWPMRAGTMAGVYAVYPRGQVFTTETLDACDRLMFWYENQSTSIEQLDNLSEALSFLKLADIDMAEFEADLLSTNPKEVKLGEPRKATAEDYENIELAMALMNDFRLNDQQRIDKLAELLIPNIVSEKTFASKVHNPNQPVRFMSPKNIRRIMEFLEKLRVSMHKHG